MANRGMESPKDGLLRRNWFHILAALAHRDVHGSAIARDVLEQTGGGVRLWPATLYRTLEDMARAGLIVELDDTQRPATASAKRRYYRSTPEGRRELSAAAEQMAGWARTARSRLRDT